jgi:hypothetical protein
VIEGFLFENPRDARDSLNIISVISLKIKAGVRNSGTFWTSGFLDLSIHDILKNKGT